LYGLPVKDSYTIVDITHLRSRVVSIVNDLDHKVILGEEQKKLGKYLEDKGVEVFYIPYPQASMEALSEYIALKLWEIVRDWENVDGIKVCVSQGSFEWACFEKRSNPSEE